MDTRPNKADVPQNVGATLADAPSGGQLGILFSPDVAFTVTCEPAQAKAAANQPAGIRISFNETCRLTAVRHSIAAAVRNARASSR